MNGPRPGQRPGPPRLLEGLLAHIADARDREWIVGDLREEYAKVAEEHGTSHARRWYARQVRRAAWPSLRRRFDRSAPPAVAHGRAGAFDALRRDGRLVRRQLTRTPLFTTGAILTLGLGLGLATAIFSVVNGVLLRPLPYANPGNLVWVWTDLTSIGVPRANTTGRQLPFFTERARTFEGFALLRTATAPLVVAGADPEQVSVTRATTGLFPLLGVEPALGRAFAPGEDGPNGVDVAVLSWGYWQRRFGGDPAVIGRSVDIDERPHTIVGVMPEDFRFVTHTSLGPTVPADLWATLRSDWAADNPGSFSNSMLGRVRSGYTVDAGIAELQALGPEMTTEFGYSIDVGVRPVALVPDLVGGVRNALLVLQAAVLVLLVAVLAGQAALLIARADRRRREITIVRALGADGRDLMRGALLESTVLALAGGAVGVVTAALMLPRFLVLVPESMPRRGDITLDGTVLLSAVAASLVVGLMTGMIPAWRSTRHGLATTLRTLSGASSDAMSRRTRRALVVAQIALSFMLIAGSALLTRSVLNLLTIDPGFATRDVTTFAVQFPGTRYADGTAVATVIEQLRERIAGLPGVAAAGATTALPLSANADQNSAVFLGSAVEQGEERPLVDVLAASPGYLDAMGISLIEGRDFDRGDTDASPAALIDRSLATLHWPGESAVGRTMLLDGDTFAIAGVVAHARLYRVDEDGRGQVLLPVQVYGDQRMAFAVRTGREPGEIAAEVRRILAQVDPTVPLANVSSADELMRQALSERRLALTLVSAFGLVALLLATLGTYTLLATTVAQRSRELGVRLAIGARPGSIVWLVLNGAVRVVLAGAILGLMLSVAANRALQGMLYGVTPTDPLTLGLTVVALTALGLLAAAMPALRAARIDPARTLREE